MLPQQLEEAAVKARGTTVNKWFDRLPTRWLAVPAIVAWAIAAIFLLEKRPYGLDEGGARAVGLLWSVAQQVATPIVTLGVPDFRAAWLAPVGILLPGSIVAARILALLLLLAAALLLFRRRAAQGEGEGALCAAGLLLLAPGSLLQVDTIGAGPFLLISLVPGAMLFERHRDEPVTFGGAYFGLLLLCAAAASLHPAGLALPARVLAHWARRARPDASPQPSYGGSPRLHILIGVPLVTLAGVFLTKHWQFANWLGNPLDALAVLVPFVTQAASAALRWIVGLAIAGAILATVIPRRNEAMRDPLLGIMALAFVLGLLAADGAWAFLAFALLLFWGFPSLLGRSPAPAGGIDLQRGLAFAVLLVACTLFLVTDRARFEHVRAGGTLDSQDEVIESLATTIARGGKPSEASVANTGPRVASQWPGRTMVACACGALPLPPSLEDQDRFLRNLRGLDYVLFDPREPSLSGLARNFAGIGGDRVETTTLLPGGVLLHVLPPAASVPTPGQGT